MLPAVMCFLLALQYGGSATTTSHSAGHGSDNTNNWSSPRVITLFILSASLLAAFAYRQHTLPESRATLPPQIVKMSSVVAGAWFTACIKATLAVTEYYVTIYLQGVRGLSAMQSGVMMLPMLLGIMAGGLAAGVRITRIGSYNRESFFLFFFLFFFLVVKASATNQSTTRSEELMIGAYLETAFMITTTILAPIAAGLLATFGLDDPDVKVPALLGFLGVAVGLDMQTPTIRSRPS